MIFIGFYVGVILKGKDTLIVMNYQNKLIVFVRLVIKVFRFYWIVEVNGNWIVWVLIGGLFVLLKLDVVVVYNGFLKVYK